uniref:Plastid lipid-associated protein/fibrillin conserved domain-containing protein n=1 Tax=Attheya septentrionalis TaxID=420275 RepID=A0A7S2ULW9_9STRA
MAPVQRHKCLVFATAALGASLLNGASTSVHAFAPRPPQQHPMPYSTVAQRSLAPHDRLDKTNPAFFQNPRHDESMVRLYATGRNKNDKSFLDKAKNVAKSILPAKWFRTKEEKKAAIELKKVRDEMSGGITELLKDAPLGVRALGKLVAPIFSKLASGIVKTLETQQRQMEDLLMDARSFLVSDPAASDALGEPIEIGAPFSQSSSSSNINGQVSTRIQTSFEVRGSYQSGVATMSANESGIQSLQLNVGSRNINVNLSGGFSGRPYDISSSSGEKVETINVPKSKLGRNRINKDDVIDVEFVEKK